MRDRNAKAAGERGSEREREDTEVHWKEIPRQTAMSRVVERHGGGGIPHQVSSEF